jgi:hypothetical protein
MRARGIVFVSGAILGVNGYVESSLETREYIAEKTREGNELAHKKARFGGPS